MEAIGPSLGVLRMAAFCEQWSWFVGQKRAKMDKN
jgi:hypothetical protein